MSFVFEINQHYVRKHLGKFCLKNKGKAGKSDWSAEDESWAYERCKKLLGKIISPKCIDLPPQVEINLLPFAMSVDIACLSATMRLLATIHTHLLCDALDIWWNQWGFHIFPCPSFELYSCALCKEDGIKNLRNINLFYLVFPFP